jgi:chromosome segregation ATPase
MMGELLQLRDLYEQTRSTHSLQLSSKIKEANSQLAAQVDSLKAEISELKDQLSAKEVEHNQAKTKRENIIKDLKRENGSLAEQFIQANTDRNWMKSEIDRLKEESRKTQGFNQNHAQKMKELTDKKEKAEKELKEAKEHVAEMEEELSDIKTKKLPEKEKVAFLDASKLRSTATRSPN